MNESKIRDPRMWKKWKESGAVGTHTSKWADRKVGLYSFGQIAEAVNTLFQIEKGFLRSDLIDQKCLAATSTLRIAGKKAVRAVCGSAIENLNPQFWAFDKEILEAKKLIAGHVASGFVQSGMETFLNVGIDSHIPRLATDRYGLFPQLNEKAKQRLLLYASKSLLEEISTSKEDAYHVLAKFRIEQRQPPTP